MTRNRQDLLETKISELTALIKELSPQARVEISFERYEDEDAHIDVYPPPSVNPGEVTRIETTIGERCNDVLLGTASLSWAPCVIDKLSFRFRRAEMKEIGIFATFTISLLLCTISFGQEQTTSSDYTVGLTANGRGPIPTGSRYN